MKLEKEPVTEMDYWQLIEGLGGLAWGINHDLADGRIDKDSKDAVITDFNEILELTGKLLSEISEKFGVIRNSNHPSSQQTETLPPLPEGEIYYWDWYKKMKKNFYTEEYSKIICSVCPLSNGLDEMVSRGGAVPCGAIRGSINRLQAPHLCGMLFDWSREELYYEIEKKGGKRVLSKFQKKEQELKKIFTEQTQK